MSDMMDVPEFCFKILGEGGSGRDKKTAKSWWVLWSVLGKWGLTVDSSCFVCVKSFIIKQEGKERHLQ